LLNSGEEFLLDAGIGSQGDGLLRLQVLQNNIRLAQQQLLSQQASNSIKVDFVK